MAVMVFSIEVANKMRDWKELSITQDAEDAVIFKFHVDHFKKVARRVVPKKKCSVAGRRKRRRFPKTRVNFERANIHS